MNSSCWTIFNTKYTLYFILYKILLRHFSEFSPSHLVYFPYLVSLITYLYKNVRVFQCINPNSKLIAYIIYQACCIFFP